MTDYRSFAQSKVDEIDKEIENLKKKKEPYLATLLVLDEAESADVPTELVNGKSSEAVARPGTMANAILELLASCRPSTTREVYTIISATHSDTTMKSIYATLHRLTKTGKVVRVGKNWSVRDLMPHHDQAVSSA